MLPSPVRSARVPGPALRNPRALTLFPSLCDYPSVRSFSIPSIPHPTATLGNYCLARPVPNLARRILSSLHTPTPSHHSLLLRRYRRRRCRLAARRRPVSYGRLLHQPRRRNPRRRFKSRLSPSTLPVHRHPRPAPRRPLLQRSLAFWARLSRYIKFQPPALPKFDEQRPPRGSWVNNGCEGASYCRDVWKRDLLIGTWIPRSDWTGSRPPSRRRAPLTTATHPLVYRLPTPA